MLWFYQNLNRMFVCVCVWERERGGMNEWVGISVWGGGWAYLWVYVCVGRCSIFLKDSCVYRGLFFLLGSLLKFLLHFAQWKNKPKNITDFVCFFFILPHKTQKNNHWFFHWIQMHWSASQEVCGDVTFILFYFFKCLFHEVLHPTLALLLGAVHVMCSKHFVLHSSGCRPSL